MGGAVLRQSAAMDPVELNERMVRLEGRMDTLQANLTATLEGFRTDQAKLREDMAKRDKDNQRWAVSLFIAAIILIPILSNSDALANLANLFGN